MDRGAASCPSRDLRRPRARIVRHGRCHGGGLGASRASGRMLPLAPSDLEGVDRPAFIRTDERAGRSRGVGLCRARISRRKKGPSDGNGSGRETSPVRPTRPWDCGDESLGVVPSATPGRPRSGYAICVAVCATLTEPWFSASCINACPPRVRPTRGGNTPNSQHCCPISALMRTDSASRAEVALSRWAKILQRGG